MDCDVTLNNPIIKRGISVKKSQRKNRGKCEKIRKHFNLARIIQKLFLNEFLKPYLPIKNSNKEGKKFH